ncbi:hypothetical protein LDVICp230 [lymphocystis disease virus-China]|uniref:Uncharacterized protein n=2 Tax=Lymphocystis disease virus 2 TaxID=159183 RepID=A0A6F8WZX4_9VIRU|nr:hypothetical protein LDVICp230 [lymphocystis disease virus-China]AAU11073.1 hypothetical protein [lymphocystis disease virus-China]BCB67547.1 hypothetical protein [Lymphocystis disease virus 2]
MEHIKQLARRFDKDDVLSDRHKFNLYLEMYCEIWLRSFAVTALKRFLKTADKQYIDLLISEGVELEKTTLFNDPQSTHRLVNICVETVKKWKTQGLGLKPVPYKFFKHPLIYKVLTSQIENINGHILTSIFIEFCLKNKWNPYDYLIDILNEDPDSCPVGRFVRIVAALLPMAEKAQKIIYEYEKAKLFHFLNCRADSVDLIGSVNTILNNEKMRPKKYTRSLLKEYTGVEWNYRKNKWYFRC